MKIPEKIKGRNRIRDAAIVLDFKKNDLSYIELAEKFNLTERRILQILSTNNAFIRRDPEWEKEKRINKRNQWIKQREAKGEISKKDLDDLLDSNRREIEGDKSLIDQSRHLHLSQVTVVIDERGEVSPAYQSRNRIQSEEQVPGTGSGS